MALTIKELTIGLELNGGETSSPNTAMEAGTNEDPRVTEERLTELCAQKVLEILGKYGEY